MIIRLCSIECNFAVPLTDPSNAAFQHDMEAWAAISNRTFVWDYVVNFGAYVQPFPNYYSLGPNVRYFLAHGVRGMCKDAFCRADALPVATPWLACAYGGLSGLQRGLIGQGHTLLYLAAAPRGGSQPNGGGSISHYKGERTVCMCWGGVLCRYTRTLPSWV